LKEERKEFQHLNDQTLYPTHEDFWGKGASWHMHIDLNACIGCGACAVACMAENNVPVVGKKEVSRHHEMTWLRVDRYFYGDAHNPNVVFQPLMCQHCHNAPCENVCPVNATNHNSEGVNQMIYNRCVGTRYCANNCPYKVRRFNWLDYMKADLWPINEPATVEGEESPFMTDNLTRMVLNPDVTVRARGVIEKCSFCTQRIQEGKLNAKKDGRELNDNDVKVACQTACPTGAITFGNINNKKSQVAHEVANPLNYQVLEEVNTRPSVTYKSKVINRDATIEA
jgi:molybdopterin-containing oxidoreductase family iron-sulfur binding subunit